MTITAGLITTNLSDVVDGFISELNDIESIFGAGRGQRTVVGHRYTYVPLEDGCLVSLWDSWSRFLRTLVVSSAAGPSVGLGGSTYAPAIERTEDDVLADLMGNKKGNNFGIVHGEPKWADPVRLTSIVTFLDLANANTITNAVTSTTITLGPITVNNPLEEVRICRNYVAHKAPPTLADVRSYASAAFTTLSVHLRRPRSGVETFSEWRDCFEALATAAAQ